MDIDKNLAGYLALVNVNDILRAPAARPLMGEKGGQITSPISRQNTLTKSSVGYICWRQSG